LFFIVLFCTVAWLGVGGSSGDAAVWAVGGLFFNVLFCTVAWRNFGGGGGVSGAGGVDGGGSVSGGGVRVSGGGGEVEGRLSASATTFFEPGTCLRSVVNSEM
jgi:hypothetical protein